MHNSNANDAGFRFYALLKVRGIGSVSEDRDLRKPTSLTDFRESIKFHHEERSSARFNPARKPKVTVRQILSMNAIEIYL